MSSYLPLEYVEYRGVNGLVAAEVLQDDKDGFATGDVFAVAGVAEISKSTNQSTEAHYYDNYAAVVVEGQSTDQITISASAIPLDVLAYITGQFYDTATAAMITSKTETKYFAIGYQYQNTKRDNIYCWRYKGTFAVPDRTVRTLDSSTDANGQELIYTGIPTRYRFEKTGKPAKAINVETAKGLVDVTAFFDEVTTPDNLEKDDDMDRVILDVNNNFALSDSDKAIFERHRTDGNFKIFINNNNFVFEVPFSVTFDSYGTEFYGNGFPPVSGSGYYAVRIYYSAEGNFVNQSYYIPLNNSTTIEIVRSSNNAVVAIRGFFFQTGFYDRYAVGSVTGTSSKLTMKPIDPGTGLFRDDYYYEYSVTNISESGNRITMTRQQINL